jgi:hypothetical protein
VHFVDDHELMRMRRQVELRVSELGEIARTLEVQVEARPLCRDRPCEGGLAHLPRTKDRYGRKVGQAFFNGLLQPTGNEHACNHGLELQNCKDDRGCPGWGRRPLGPPSDRKLGLLA